MIDPHKLWSRLLNGGRGRRNTARLRVQPLGFSDAQLRHVERLCAGIGEALELLVEVDRRAGDVVLAESAWARGKPPQSLARLADARPVLTCELDDTSLQVLERFEQRQRELLAQLLRLPLVRDRSPQFGASGWGPELSATAAAAEAPALPEALPMSAEQLRLVTWLLRGLADPEIPPLTLSYGVDALIRVDFAQAFALVDPLAQQALRVHRALPSMDDEGGKPGADAIERGVDDLVWDMGLAFGRLRLLDQPEDWWHTPLSVAPQASVRRYTRVPRLLALADVALAGRQSPERIQQRSGCSVAELRPFLQACLFLGLIWWSPDL